MNTNPSNTNAFRGVQVLFVVGLFLALSNVLTVMNGGIGFLESNCDNTAGLSQSSSCLSSNNTWYLLSLCLIPFSAIAFGLTAFARTGFFVKQPAQSLIPATIDNPQSQPRPVSSITAPIVPTSPITQNGASIEDELQKAADMLAKGLIDEEEYKQLKQKIISKA